MGLHGKNLITNNMKLILLFLLFPLAAMSQAQQDTLVMPPQYTVKTGVNYTFTIPEIPVLQNQVNNVTERVKALENAPATGSGKQVNTSTYTITQADNGSLLIITTSCTITISTGLKAGFTCTVKRIGGDVRYTGNSLFSYSNWRRSSRQYENVYVESDGINNYLSGNLKL